MIGFEGIGDFDSDDPWQRYIAHQAAKGNLNRLEDVGAIVQEHFTEDEFVEELEEHDANSDD